MNYGSFESLCVKPTKLQVLLRNRQDASCKLDQHCTKNFCNLPEDLGPLLISSIKIPTIHLNNIVMGEAKLL